MSDCGGWFCLPDVKSEGACSCVKQQRAVSAKRPLSVLEATLRNIDVLDSGCEQAFRRPGSLLALDRLQKSTIALIFFSVVASIDRAMVQVDSSG